MDALAEQDVNANLLFGTWDTNANDGVFSSVTSEVFTLTSWTVDFTVTKSINVDDNFEFEFELEADLMSLFSSATLTAIGDGNNYAQCYSGDPECNLIY